MALFKCKMCGGSLEVATGATVAECEYCGTQQTLPRLDDDRKANLYDRANHFRRNNEFDKAMGIYEQILNEDRTDAEAYWSLVLCRYGIEYVEDPASRRRLPTVNRAQFTSVFDDDNYKSALQYADSYQKAIYEAEAKAINEIQKGILCISQKEAPFDVFICYKETDNNGRRTPDSVLAQELYYQLTQEGFKVFFSRITLEDKLGSAYEPYIFAALNSAKVMVALGTKPEYFKAVWVRNEWSRYLALIKSGAKKMLIPAYKDMDPYDLPEEFSHLQAQDMSKLGFMQDLIRGIKKILDADAPKTTGIKETVVAGNANTAPLLKRVFLFLEDKDWDSANEYCEKVLDIDPECAQAYLGKLMAELCVEKQDELRNEEEPFDRNSNYQKTLRFADDKLKKELTGYIVHINTRNENARLEGIYNRALNMMKSAVVEGSYKEAAGLFLSIADYKDAAVLAEECRKEAEETRNYAIYNTAKISINKRVVSIAEYQSAIAAFQKIRGWKDADNQIILCQQRIDEIKAKAEADRLERERKAELDRIEAKKQSKRKKITATIVVCVVLLAVAFAIVFNTIIIPNSKYNHAVALMDEGKYQEAISIFESLNDFKDSKDKMLDVKYSEAVALLEAEKYTEAIKAFTELGAHKDAAQMLNEASYRQAESYIQEKQYYDASVLLQKLSVTTEYAEKAELLFEKAIDGCCTEGDFALAISIYKKTKGYDETSALYKDLVYQSGMAAMKSGAYLDAVVAFNKIPGYLDVDNQLLEANYQRALDYIQRGIYDAAVDALEQLGDYKDSKSQILELKYQYVQEHLTNTDTTTHAYLKELTSVQYRDCATIWDELYTWKISLQFVNTTKDDYGTSLSYIPTSSSYLHMVFDLTGGEPGEKITIYHTYQWPGEKAYTSDWMWENNISGGRLGVEWSSGVSTSKGTFVMKFYNSQNNKLIATISIPVGKTNTTTMKPGGSHGDTIVLESSGFFVTANAGVLVSSTGSSKDVLELTTEVASAARFTIRENNDGTITFVAANGKFLMADGNDVQLVSKENDYTKFVIEKTNGGVFIRCAVASYAGKPQYLEIYNSKLTCYGMNADYEGRYLFQLLIP